MEAALLYSIAGVALFGMGLFSLIMRTHPLRKILSVNIMAVGVFLLLIAMAYTPQGSGEIDPLPHSMVLTGIVVSVSVTALALILACRVQETSNRTISAERKKTKPKPRKEA